MARWYENNRRLFREETEILVARHPYLKLVIVKPGFRINEVCTIKKDCAVVHGIYKLGIPDTDRHIDYRIALVLPDNYPKRFPVMFCNDPKLPLDDIDRHILKDGSACLGVHADILMRWKPETGIIGFIEDLVGPFLAWQAFYDAFDRPPPWGARSHFGRGILEFYSELLGLPPEVNPIGFMRLLAKKGQPKGHEICPCNSGKKLRNCHREIIYRAREQVRWQTAEADLKNCENLTKMQM